MTRLEKVKLLVQYLLEDSPEYITYCKNIPQDYTHQRALLRSLMNLRYSEKKLCPSFYTLQDELLMEEAREKGIVSSEEIPVVNLHPALSLWQGDITRLKVDAIVNAANSQLLGCFIPCHSCIDNAIHSAAGLQLREECSQIMRHQGHEEPTGQAKITKGYNLPANYILHTVGPIIYDSVTEEKQKLLASCYQSCLELADQYKLESIAFCCISTGEFHFPNNQAAAIAVNTVLHYFGLHSKTSIKKVIFNVFKNTDLEIYWKLLNQIHPTDKCKK